MTSESERLWEPDKARIDSAEMSRFMRYLHDSRGLQFDDYHALWRWSVADIAGFWEALWQFYRIDSQQPSRCVLEKPSMPGARWFPGARLNFAEHLLRAGQDRPDTTALLHASETHDLQSLSWRELSGQVARLAHRLREAGVAPGDRVVAFMPNAPETVVACIACLSIGAVWSVCSPEFGTATVLDRFAQIEPTLLIAVDSYGYGGKVFDRQDELREIVRGLPSLRAVIHVPGPAAHGAAPLPGCLDWTAIQSGPVPAMAFESVDFDHPLWVVYSSGTTGLPKAIVHGHGGVLLELHKMLGLHGNLSPGKHMLFYTSSGWIMWNILISALLVGAVPVLYDGHPAAPEIDLLWRLAGQARVNLFGASPTYLAMMQKHGVVPGHSHDLSNLEGVLLTGSPATPESMQWLYDNVKADLWVTSQSGGTDVASAFVNGSCILPVHAGEIQARALAVDAQAWDDAGRSVIGEVGELVITQPMPSMPLYLWNDPDGERYRQSYFEPWPGVWRHGDFFELNARGGCFIRGRSDATLNRYGVRIGTAEIYRCVEALEEIEEALVVNLDLPGGRFHMPLFVQMASGACLDDALIARINQALRENCSPRHVPDEIIAVPEIPYTLTGKKLEVPVRKILLGARPDRVASRDAMRNPDALDAFCAAARQMTALRKPAQDDQD